MIFRSFWNRINCIAGGTMPLNREKRWSSRGEIQFEEWHARLERMLANENSIFENFIGVEILGKM